MTYVLHTIKGAIKEVSGFEATYSKVSTIRPGRSRLLEFKKKPALVV